MAPNFIKDMKGYDLTLHNCPTKAQHCHHLEKNAVANLLKCPYLHLFTQQQVQQWFFLATSSVFFPNGFSHFRYSVLCRLQMTTPEQDGSGYHGFIFQQWEESVTGFWVWCATPRISVTPPGHQWKKKIQGAPLLLPVVAVSDSSETKTVKLRENQTIVFFSWLELRAGL